MFIVTKLIHIKYGYESELLYGLKQYYPSPGKYKAISFLPNQMLAMYINPSLFIPYEGENDKVEL